MANDSEAPKKALSCFQCRARKLKCDRAWPCSRCSQAGIDCHFPEGRQRPAFLTRRPRVKELEARLRELEQRYVPVEADTTPSDQQPLTPESPADSQLASTGRYESLPPQPVMDELLNLYFSMMHSEVPMVDPVRYRASLHMPPRMQPPMCLQYATLAVAAGFAPNYKQMAQPFYLRAREYAQADEFKGDGQHATTLQHVQCWVLLSVFEAAQLWYTRACLSLGRAARTAQMLELHAMDSADEMPSHAPPPRDWSEAEERRRTLWSLFCVDRIGGSTTGYPMALDVGKITTLLPVAEESFLLGLEMPSWTLDEALTSTSAKYPPFVGRLVAAHLFYEAMRHTFGHGEDASNDEKFWSLHRELDDRLALTFMNLPDSLRGVDNASNRDAVFVNLTLHTTNILVHRVAASRARSNPLSADQVASATVRLLTSANEIFSVISALGSSNGLFLFPFITMAVFVAALVFLDDFAATHDKRSEGSLTMLMEVLAVLAQQNPMAASMAVELAQELRKSGINHSATEQVQALASQMDKSGLVLVGRNDPAKGTVNICPLQPVLSSWPM